VEWEGVERGLTHSSTPTNPSMKVLLRVQGKISKALVLGRLFEDHGKRKINHEMKKKKKKDLTSVIGLSSKLRLWRGYLLS